MGKPIRVWILSVLLLSAEILRTQPSRAFHVQFELDFQSADELLEYFDWKHSNIDRILSLRGTQLARQTSLLLAREQLPISDFREHLEGVRAGNGSETDRYGLHMVRNNTTELRALVTQLKQYQLHRRISATLEAYFPPDLPVDATFRVYFVVFGNDRATAVVRRVRWQGNEPLFVRDGEPTILVNVAQYGSPSIDMQAKVLALMGTLTHEAFHAVYEMVREQLPDSLKATTPAETLLELIHNEGIAYYISLELQGQGRQLSPQWYRTTEQAFTVFERALRELQNPSTPPQRVRELILNANLSGDFSSNYGVAVGQRMAYEIDTRLGRRALRETLKGGFRSFFQRYRECVELYPELPPVRYP